MALMKKLTAAVAASSLVLGLVGTAFAGYTPAEGGKAAGTRLMDLKVISGKPGTTLEEKLALSDKISRAEFVTIMVGAYNKAELAAAAKGLPSYSDAANNTWDATGYIYVAKNLIEQQGASMGKPGGLFDPKGEVSAAEAVAFLMKFLGIKEDASKTWPNSAIDAAVAAGLITADDKATIAPIAAQPATRGLVFYLMDQAFYSYKLASGKTIYTTYADATEPTATVTSKLVDNTIDATYEVTGTAGDAVSIEVGGEAATINADGTFKAEAALEVGDNDIAVVARDLAGNAKTFTLKITRSTGAAASIAAADFSVVAGESIELDADVLDANENVIADATITGTSTLGTVEAGKFVAGEKAGTADLTLTSGAITKTVKVTVTAGALAQIGASADSAAQGEIITLTAQDKFGNAISGSVTWTVDSAKALVGQNGTFMGSEAGTYTVTATSSTGATATKKVGVYAETAESLVISAPTSIVANGATMKTVKVSIVDEFGNLIVTADAENITLEGVGVTVYDAEGVADDTVATEDGVATFLISLDPTIAGDTITLNASFGAVEGSADVTAVAQVATKVEATGAKFLTANSASTADIEVTVVDQEGEAMVDGVEYVISAANVGPAELSADSGSYTGTAVTFTLDNATSVGAEGTNTVTFTVEGVGTATYAVKQVIAGNPAKIAITDVKVGTEAKTTAKATEAFTFTVEFQDRNGVPVAVSAAQAAELEVTLPDEVNAEVTGLTVAADNVTATFTVSTLAPTMDALDPTVVDHFNPFTGALAVTVELDGLTAASKTVNFVPGAVANIALDRSGLVAPVANPTGNYSVSMIDAKGNTVAESGVELEAVVEVYDELQDDWFVTEFITLNGKTTTTAPVELVTGADGKVALTVAARPYAGYLYRVVVVTADTTDSIGDIASFAVESSVVSSITTKLYKAVEQADGSFRYIPATNVKAGDKLYLKASAKDNYGSVMTFTDPTALTVKADEVLGDGAGNLVDGSGFAFEAADGTYSFSPDASFHTDLGLTADDLVVELEAGKAGLTTIGAQYSATQTAVVGTSNVVVNVGAAADILVNGGDDITIDAGVVAGPYTVQFVDEYGNAVSFSTAQDIEITSDAELSLRTTSGGATVAKLVGKSSATFYVVGTTAGTYTITFTGEGGETGSISVTVE